MLGFAASADFAGDKPPRTPCRHLRDDFGCGIHSRLVERGYPGCTAYDCFGAGQLTIQVTFGGRTWRESPEVAEAVFDVFGVQRRLQELRWYLREARAVTAAAPLHPDLDALRAEVEELTRLPATDLVALDVAPVHGRVDALLRRASESARAEVPPPAPTPRGGRGRRAPSRPLDRRDRRRANLAGRDLIGADLREADLRGADLRGALLLAADLRGARLDRADLIGADLRDADLRGADLAGALFLTRFQVGAARGDAATVLPAGLERPARWEQAPPAGAPPGGDHRSQPGR